MDTIQEVSFQEIRAQIIDSFRTSDILPVLGAGFTMHCKTALDGQVPSGDDCAKQMLELIRETNELDETSISQLRETSLKDISEIFNEVVPESKRLDYFKKNFSKVKFGKKKTNFLKINWDYIYTLNIDDGIETNSLFTKVITITNRTIRDDIFKDKKCVIKLHGDIDDYMTYEDGVGLVFSLPSYIKLLSKNKKILKRLTHDIQYKNIIYIGCSLDGELDILKTTTSISEKDIKNTNRYYFTANELNALQKIYLKKYQISQIVKFNTFDEIYEQLASAWDEACKISVNDLTLLGRINFQIAENNMYNTNKEYLFSAKSVSLKTNDFSTAQLPYFFIEREKTNEIIQRLQLSSLIILRGHGCAGKTYILYDLVRRIKKVKVFLFQTKERLSDTAFDALMRNQNSFFLFDESSLSYDQINHIFDQIPLLEKRNLHAVIVSNMKSDFVSIQIDTMVRNSVLSEEDVINIPNRFSDNEMENINNKLLTCNLGVFQKKSIIDNIISLGEQHQEEHTYRNISPSHKTIKDLAVLIILAMQHKIYSYQAVQFDLVSEINKQIDVCYPLIEEETTFSFERDAKDNSNRKYVINAEYWLYLWLSDFANEDNFSFISRAFSYIMGKILQYNGDITINRTDNKTYQQYIWFNNINKIFNLPNNNKILLIKMIYDDLAPLLSVEPGYNHQRAKAYIRCAYYALRNRNVSQAESDLKDALHFVIGSIGIYQKRFDDSGNENVKISLDHSIYTHAIILCHLLKLHNYSDINEIQLALENLYKAFLSPNNSYSYARRDTINFDNVLIETITYLFSNCNGLDSTHKTYLEYLVNTSRNNISDS